ncbi:hypothetical protein FSP39_022368 [Pinctada imbricata]|uniref:Uncharacterized protein n=1 Tax=Pinctada imbricata TaxID=66713 RepID=A0AA88Y5R7_PINIB|nr:hypothetical protein FSP39_022368 [Pinctada imbricata]
MPTMLASSRPHVWSQNTSYTGVTGQHSENNYSSIARHFGMENQLFEKMEILSKMHQKNLKQFDRNKRKMEQSLTAYTEKLKHANKERLNMNISRRLKDIPEVDSAKSSILLSEKHQADKSDESFSSDALHRPRRHLSPIRVKRPERKMTFNGRDNVVALDQMKARFRWTFFLRSSS